MPGFLQCCFSFVRLRHSFSVRNSDEVVKFMEPFDEKQSNVITLDIQDLYYSIPHDKLFLRLRNLLEGDLGSF